MTVMVGSKVYGAHFAALPASGPVLVEEAVVVAIRDGVADLGRMRAGWSWSRHIPVVELHLTRVDALVALRRRQQKRADAFRQDAARMDESVAQVSMALDGLLAAAEEMRDDAELSAAKRLLGEGLQ